MEFPSAIFSDYINLSKHLIHTQSHLPSLTLSILATSPSTTLPVAAVRSDPHKPPPSIPRAPSRRSTRVRRRSATEDGGDDGFSGDDGPFGGGGKGWGLSGGSGWEEPDPSSSSDPVFGAVYEFMCWIALSNCTHFAFKKMRSVVAEREKDLLSIGVVLPLC